MSIIEIHNITKQYRQIRAVAGVDLEVESGECFGLLGPNGAGKTTLVKMVTAVAPITSGQAIVAGMDVTKDPRRVKSLIGVVPQEENLDPDFSVMKNLLVFARYFDIPSDEAKKRAIANLELFELDARQKAKIDELSGGMKRRLLIARALINQPRILVLDEPTVGLDPQTRHMVWRKLKSLKDQDVTLLLTTQNMEEAAFLCDRLAIMNEGRIIALDVPERMIAEYGGNQIIEAGVEPSNTQPVRSALEQLGIYWQELGETFYIFQSNETDFTGILAEKLVVQSRRKPTLEDVFLRLTGRSLTE